MDQNQINLLLIEDDHNIPPLIQESLEIVNYTNFNFNCTDTLSKGIDFLKNNSIDIILLDLNLPDSSGFDTFDRLNKQYSQIPIIILTGMEDESLGALALKKSAQGYLSKSQLVLSELPRIILNAIDRHKLFIQTKLVSEKLEQSEKRFKKIISNDADGIIIMNKKNIILFTNPAADEILGKNSTDLLGSEFEYSVDGHENKEICINLDDSSSKIVEIKIVKINWDNEECFLISMRDMTDKKQIEYNLQIATIELEKLKNELNNLKNEFNKTKEEVAKIDPEEKIKLLESDRNNILRKVSMLTNEFKGQLYQYSDHIKKLEMGINIKDNVLVLRKVMNDFEDLVYQLQKIGI